MSLFTSIAGLALGVVGGITKGNAQKAAANDQGNLDDYNASVATLQAQDAVARGATDEARYRTSVQGMIGKQRAAQAGNNVDVNTGSSVDVQSDAAFLGEIDALTIRTNAARTAWGYNVQAENDTRAGQIAREGGQAAQTAGIIGAGTTALAGTSSLLQAKYGAGGDN